jgi:diguanylate cyclase (GGDEF)-like protein/PAS domain S-box-containing protein
MSPRLSTEALAAIEAHLPALALGIDVLSPGDRRYRDLIEALGVAVYTTDSEGHITFFNQAAGVLWGWNPPLRDQLWCGSWRLLWPDGTPLRHDECPMAVCLKESRPVRGVWAYAERPDGVRVPFAPFPTPLYDEHGTLVGAVNVLVDITGIAIAETARAVTEARFRAAQHLSPEGFLVVEAIRRLDRRVEDFSIIYANPAATWMLRPQTGQLEQSRLGELFPKDARVSSDMVAICARVMATGKTAWRDIRYKAPGRQVRWLRHRAVPLDDGVAIAFEDITQRRRAEERIHNLALHDPLTGLPNRHHFNATIGQALGNPGSGFAVLFFDLDRFKIINDTFGHHSGDIVLRMAAKRLRAMVRRDDVVARLGGDEFTAILMNGGPAEAVTASKRVITAVSEPFQIGDYRTTIEVSVGILVVPDGGRGTLDVETLLKQADLALYRAKAQGRGSYCVFAEAMETQRKARIALETDLREAIARGELEVHYQPIYDLQTNRLGGFEALARWRHPIRGMISPTEFIPVAEETGLVVQMGRWVLRRACADAAGWPEDLKVAVNLSALQFAGGGLAETVQAMLAETGLAAKRLELEITESVLLAQNEAVSEVLRRLRTIGVRVALDDFGTQYSSLSYLRSFPFDKIKIDQSFVRDALGRPDCMAIVRSFGRVAGPGTWTAGDRRGR